MAGFPVFGITCQSRVSYLWKHLAVRAGFPFCEIFYQSRVSYLWNHMFEQGSLTCYYKVTSLVRIGFFVEPHRAGLPTRGSICQSTYLWEHLSDQSFLFAKKPQNRVSFFVEVLALGFLFVEGPVRSEFPVCGSTYQSRVSYLWKHLLEQGFLFLEATVRTGFPICGSTCLSRVSYLWKQLLEHGFLSVEATV